MATRVRNWTPKGRLRRVSGGAAIGKIAVKVYICRGCEEKKIGEPKPSQCPKCGRMDFTTMHSTGEANRLGQLNLLLAAGKISDLRTQVTFSLYAAKTTKTNQILPVEVGKYIADFVYIRDGEQVIEDYKGAISDVSAWKLRHMAAQGLPVKISTG